MELRSWLVSLLCPREVPRQCLNEAGSVASSWDKLSREISGFVSDAKGQLERLHPRNPDFTPPIALGSSESPL